MAKAKENKEKGITHLLKQAHAGEKEREIPRGQTTALPPF